MGINVELGGIVLYFVDKGILQKKRGALHVMSGI